MINVEKQLYSGPLVPCYISAPSAWNVCHYLPSAANPAYPPAFTSGLTSLETLFLLSFHSLFTKESTSGLSPVALHRLFCPFP